MAVASSAVRNGLALALSTLLLLAWLVLVSFRVTTTWTHALLVLAAGSFFLHWAHRRGEARGRDSGCI